MTFIGMISDHKSFDKVKEELKEPQLELININKKSIGNIKVTFGDKTFITNFMGLARFQAQENSLTNQLGYVIIYIAFITLTFKFTFMSSFVYFCAIFF